MSPADLLAHVRRRPFVPFRVVTSDGAACEVRQPELVMVTSGSAIIGHPAPRLPGVAERFAIVSLQHIVWLEVDDASLDFTAEGAPPREDS
jgi:hypothetical protein